LVPAARLETPAERQARQQRARDTDGDGFYDQDDRCPEEAEVFNGMNDHDGCPDSQQASVVDNRIVIDERVFFDYDEATLRPEGKQQLDEIVRLYQAEGDDWSRLRVAGHADRRGPEPYNMDLSRQRAAAVRGYLIEQGVPESLIDIEAYGENRPLIPDANIPAEFQMNRRVEFMVERGARRIRPGGCDTRLAPSPPGGWPRQRALPPPRGASLSFPAESPSALRADRCSRSSSSATNRYALQTVCRFRSARSLG